MEWRIRHPGSCMLTNCRSLAIFSSWYILEACNIRIYMWPTLSVEVPQWWTDRFEGWLLLLVMARGSLHSSPAGSRFFSIHNVL